eukprot:NODE_561_length_6036_cov_1.205491.p3 type:complete len:222 gc:universal NODE_561_length_6036_cov_1.205491:2639-1974(-)
MLWVTFILGLITSTRKQIEVTESIMGLHSEYPNRIKDLIADGYITSTIEDAKYNSMCAFNQLLILYDRQMYYMQENELNGFNTLIEYRVAKKLNFSPLYLNVLQRWNNVFKQLRKENIIYAALEPSKQQVDRIKEQVQYRFLMTAYKNTLTNAKNIHSWPDIKVAILFMTNWFLSKEVPLKELRAVQEFCDRNIMFIPHQSRFNLYLINLKWMEAIKSKNQ